MATSSKASKTAGSDRKAATAGKKAGGSGPTKAATRSGRKTGSPGSKTSAGSGKTGSSSGRKASAGSARKASAGSGRKASADSGPKASADSGRKASADSGRKASAGSGQKASGSGRRISAGSGTKASSSRRKASGSTSQKGIYVYGVVPADVELTSDVPGVGDPPGQIRVVRSDGLAALVSEVDLSQQLGSPDDLAAHKEILDASAEELPVLPLRFGAVLTSEDAVAEELLAANRDEFAEALDELDGRAQFVVKGRYVEDVILDEVLSENKQAARLRDKLRGTDPDATRDARIKLGEILNEAVTAKRLKDTRALGDAMKGHCVASVVREPTHELDAVHVAFLVDADREDDMEQAIENLAGDWDGRIEVRLIGPMAAYDFVGSTLREG